MNKWRPLDRARAYGARGRQPSAENCGKLPPIALMDSSAPDLTIPSSSTFLGNFPRPDGVSEMFPSVTVNKIAPARLGGGKNSSRWRENSSKWFKNSSRWPGKLV